MTDIRSALLEMVHRLPEWHPDPFCEDLIDDLPFVELDEDQEPEWPSFPKELFNRLPTLFQRMCDFFRVGYERDIFLIMSISVFSALIPQVRVYYGKEEGLNIYCIVIAPPGSGKGSAQRALRIGELADLRVFEKSKREREQWETDRAMGRTDKPRPPLKRIYVGANASHAGLVEAINNNDGKVLVYSTEALTWVNVMLAEWGQCEDIYLKGFHSEKIDQSRKGTFVRIPRPEISVCLTGTPGPSSQVFKSIEGGLLSRFLIYCYNAPPVFQNQFARDSDRELDNLLDTVAKMLDNANLALSRRTSPLQFLLSSMQESWVNDTFRAKLHDLHMAGVNSALYASVKRAALIAVRISGIFTFSRHIEKNTPLDEIEVVEATDDDVFAGITISEYCLKHAIRFANRFPGNAPEMSQKELDFLNALPPDTFATSEAVSIGKDLGVSRTWVFEHLKKYKKDRRLIWVAHGKYKKPEASEMSMEL